MDLDLIRELDGQLFQQDEALDVEKESLQAIYAAAKANGIRPDAMKSARRLRRMKPQDLRAWLLTFDACREAFDLDAQMDIEDVVEPPSAIRKIAKDLKKLADEKVTNFPSRGKPN